MVDVGGIRTWEWKKWRKVAGVVSYKPVNIKTTTVNYELINTGQMAGKFPSVHLQRTSFMEHLQVCSRVKVHIRRKHLCHFSFQPALPVFLSLRSSLHCYSLSFPSTPSHLILVLSLSLTSPTSTNLTLPIPLIFLLKFLTAQGFWRQALQVAIISQKKLL